MAIVIDLRVKTIRPIVVSRHTESIAKSTACRAQTQGHATPPPSDLSGRRTPRVAQLSTPTIHRDVEYHDPFVPEIKPTREHPHWAGQKSLPWTREAIGFCDAVLIATNHKDVSYQELAAWSACIIDTRNAVAEIETQPGQVTKA